jgi:asparagine synthetase B (glutamine-hydrolysing)
MMGFLVHDGRLFSSDKAVSGCRALRTYSYEKTQRIGGLSIHFFRNTWGNNYYVQDDRYTLCVAGTLIFNGMHGSAALRSLREELSGGRSIIDLFDQLRGPYTLIQLDSLRGEVTILNSREGLRNCYLAEGHGLRAYSTNMLLLAALTGAPPDPAGVREFLHIGTVLEQKTIFENIQLLPAASVHTYRGNTWTARRLWRLQTLAPDRTITRESATNAVTNSFVRNLDFTRLLPSGRVAADLTGGTDSRTVLCCLMEDHPAPVASTSGPADFVDVRIARRVAEKLGIEHYWYKPASVNMTPEQIATAVEIADGSREVVEVAKLLPYYQQKAQRFDFITGGGGGPLFKDHYWLYEFNRVGLRREPHWDRIATFSLVKYAVRDDFLCGYSDRIMDHLAAMLRRRSGEVNGTNNQKLDFVYFDLKVPAFGGQDFSLTTQFMDTYHPLLDGETVQYSINLPPEIRIQNILLFGIIQRLRPELRWVLTDNGIPAIPPVGLDSWLRMLRARRYIQAGFRKLRRAAMGASGEQTDQSGDIAQLEKLGYFDLLEHRSLAVSSSVSAATLANFKKELHKQPNQYYLIGTLSLQLFFDRAKELMREAQKVAA